MDNIGTAASRLYSFHRELNNATAYPSMTAVKHGFRLSAADELMLHSLGVERAEVPTKQDFEFVQRALEKLTKYYNTFAKKLGFKNIPEPELKRDSVGSFLKLRERDFEKALQANVRLEKQREGAANILKYGRSIGEIHFDSKTKEPAILVLDNEFLLDFAKTNRDDAVQDLGISAIGLTSFRRDDGEHQPAGVSEFKQAPTSLFKLFKAKIESLN